MPLKRPPRDNKAAVVRHRAREDFLAFLFLYLARRFPADAIALLTAWRYRALSYKLRQIDLGLGGRLLLSLPPFFDAATLVSVVFTAWLLGRRPEATVLCISASKDIARRYAEACRTLMEEPWYKELFPGVQLKSKGHNELRTTSGGGRFSASVQGAQPGVAADVVIVDEPLLASEAVSEAVSTQQRTWIADALATLTERRPALSAVFVSPRVQADDIAAHLLKDGGWDHLELPAVTKEARLVQIGEEQFHNWPAGVALDPGRFPPEALQKLRRDIGPVSFASRYQQRPVHHSEDLVEGGWLRSEKSELHGSFTCSIGSWVEEPDDPRGCQRLTFVRVEMSGRTKVVEVMRQEVTWEDLPNLWERFYRDERCDYMLANDSEAGTELLEHAQSDWRRPAFKFRTVALSPEEARRLIVEAVDSGMIVLPDGENWTRELEHQLLDAGSDEKALTPAFLALAQVVCLMRREKLSHFITLDLGGGARKINTGDDEQDGRTKIRKLTLSGPLEDTEPDERRTIYPRPT